MSETCRPNAETLPGFGGNKHGLDLEQVGDLPGEQRAGAAERDEAEAARVATALDRHLPDAVGLVPGGDLEDAGGRLLDR